MSFYSTLRPVVSILGSVFAFGCVSSERSVTNQSHPGPAIGAAVGTVAGAVAGQVSGAVVSGAQSAGAAAAAPFNNEHRIVRTWRTETTADGRTIQVPVDTEVDQYGRPIAK